jgi:hypothetical protein
MRDLRSVRLDAEVQREQSLVMRYRARRQRDHARSTYDRLLAVQILDVLSEPDLQDLEEVTPPLRLIPGGLR